MMQSGAACSNRKRIIPSCWVAARTGSVVATAACSVAGQPCCWQGTPVCSCAGRGCGWLRCQPVAATRLDASQRLVVCNGIRPVHARRAGGPATGIGQPASRWAAVVVVNQSGGRVGGFPGCWRCCWAGWRCKAGLAARFLEGLNVVRGARASCWQSLCLPLVAAAWAKAGQSLWRYWLPGVNVLALASLAVIVERWLFPRLDNFASDYRATSLFHEMFAGARRWMSIWWWGRYCLWG